MKIDMKVTSKAVSALFIVVLFVILSLTGCASNPRTEFENCIKEDGKVNPNYYDVQLKCSNKTGYYP